ncbi:MAG: hypothetical protein RDV48_17110 [Candidatus Eremiobacteraeota bacterium]|nr:hypothetical protein [Candidatus Eremiobacteraeota bacterium]
MSMEVLEKILSREETMVGRQFVAPVIAGRKVQMRHSGAVRELSLARSHEGWGVFAVRAGGRAGFVREAEEWERQDYLASCRRVSMLLFHRDMGGTWWACDMGRGRAIAVHLVEGCRMFDRIVVAHDGLSHLFVYLDEKVSPEKGEKLREAFVGERPAETLSLDFFTARELEAYVRALDLHKITEKSHKEAHIRRIEEALRLGEGHLVECTEVDAGYRVIWTRNGVGYSTILDRNLSVLSAGFCLAGGDRLQDITSLSSLVALRGTIGDRPR